MNIEQMREAVHLSDRIKKLEDSQKRVRKATKVRISPWAADGKGSIEAINVPGKAAAALYRPLIRELKAKLAELQP